MEKIIFCGYEISNGKKRPNPAKVEDVRQLKNPTCKKTAQKLFGLLNYHRSFIKDFATIAAPITKCYGGKNAFNWTKEAEKSLDELKQEICSKAMELQIPIAAKSKFVLETDASETGFGACLFVCIEENSEKHRKQQHWREQHQLQHIPPQQQHGQQLQHHFQQQRHDDQQQQQPQIGKNNNLHRHQHQNQLLQHNLEQAHQQQRHLEQQHRHLQPVQMEEHKHSNKCLRPIEYFSGKFTDSQQNYYIQEKELYAGKEALKKWQHYLLGRTFDWRMDNACLKWAHRVRSCNRRISQWLAEIQEFDPKIILTPSTDMKITDCLSRQFVETNMLSIRKREMCNLQENDPVLKKIRKYVAEDRWPRKPSQNEKTFARNRQFLTFGQEGELVFRTESETKLVPPNSIKDDLIQVYHDQNGHPGEKQLTQQLQRNYFWPGLVREVQNFVKTCHNCQIRKPNLKPEKTPHGLSFTPKRPFEMLAIDLIGPLPITNRANKFALVVVDTFSKFVYTWALQTKEMRPIAAILRKLIFSKPKRPRFILSDNGTEFRLIPDLCAELGIKHNAAAPYHPQTNGAVERTNQTLKNRLFVTGSEDWDLKIDQVTHGINCSNNAVTRISPFQAEMGVNGDIFGDNIEKDEEEIGNLNEERIRTFERLLEEKDIRTAKMDNPAYEGFQVGQKVLARNLHKRAPNHPISLITHRYTGPYTIIERREQGLTYVIRNDETGATTIRHAIHLKYYHQREFPEEQVPLVPEQPYNPDEQHLFTEEMDQEVQATTTPPAAAPESFNEENPTSSQRTMREEQPSQQMLRNIRKRIDYSSSEDELYLPPIWTKIPSTHRSIPVR